MNAMPEKNEAKGKGIVYIIFVRSAHFDDASFPGSFLKKEMLAYDSTG